MSSKKRSGKRTLRRASWRSRKAFFEQLETRNMLTIEVVILDIDTTEDSYPSTASYLIVRNPATSSPETVNFTISGSATEGAWPLDFILLDVHNNPLPSHQVTILANETSAVVRVLAFDDPWIEGTEGVTLTVGGDAETIEVIDNDDTAGITFFYPYSTNCDCSCSCTAAATSTDASMGMLKAVVDVIGIISNSVQAAGIVIAGANVEMTDAAEYSTSVEIKTKIKQNDQTWTDSSESVYNGGADEDEYQFAVQIPDSDFAEEDGYYPVEVKIIEHYPYSDDVVRTVQQKVKVFSYAGGEFGKGWLPSSVDRLKIVERADYDGALWIRGDYNAFWFEKIDDEYQRELGELDYSTLEEDGGDFVLTKQNGEVLRFDGAGESVFMIETRTDRNGNVTSYTYIDADGDGQADEIETITRPGGLATTYYYTGAYVTSMEDPYGRIYVLDNDGTLNAITEPDPDGAGPLTSPVTEFTYTGNQIASITDAEGNTTSYTYSQKMLRTITHPGGGVETFYAQYGRALEDAPGTVGDKQALVLTSSIVATYTNEVDSEWNILFNNNGKSLSMINPIGKVTDYEYFNYEFLVTERTDPDPDGAGPQSRPVAIYTYSGRNLVQRGEWGQGEQWSYGTFNQLTSYTNPGGDDFIFGLDEFGNATEIREYVGGSTTDSIWTLTYSDSGIKGLVTSVIDPREFETTYSYNAHGMLTGIVHPDESEESFTYDAYDNLETWTDPMGRVTTYTWDLLDRLTSVTLPDPDGGGGVGSPAYLYEYDKNRQLIRETDPLGYVTEYDYNGRLDVVEMRQPDPDDGGPAGVPTTTYEYDNHRRLLSVTDPLGRVTSYEYDPLDNVTSITLPDPDAGGAAENPVYDYTYDFISRLIAVEDPLAHVTAYDLSTWNEVITTYADATETTDRWDGLGRPTLHIDELENATVLYKDAMGLVITLAQPESAVWEFDYDKSHNLIAAEDPLSNTTTYEYDEMNRLIEMNQPTTSNPTTYTWNASGELTSVTDPLGNVTEYGYDGLGRLITLTEADPDGGGPAGTPVTSYTYDANSRLTSVTDPRGNTTTYEYDGLGRLITVTEEDPDGGGGASAPVWEYTYDLVGNLLSVTDPLDRETTYAYDDLDRLIEMTGPDPDGEGGASAPVTTYTYDAVGNLLTVTDPLGNTTTYDYDVRYRVISILQPDPDGGGGAGAPFTEYERDAVGRIIKITDPLSRVTEYVRDDLGRIVSVTDPMEGVTEYAYDVSSNLVSVTDVLGNVTTHDYDGLNRRIETALPDPDGTTDPLALLTSPVISYDYDDNGNLTSVTDPLGYVTSYAYDGLNRRISMTQPDPDAGGALASPVTSYAYDAAGNLTGVTDPLSHVTAYAYDGLNRNITITEADPDGGGGLSSPVTSFTYDAAGQLTSVTDPMSRLTSYEYNGLGQRTKVTEPDPDGAGGAARPFTTLAYDAVGNLLTVTDPLTHVTSYDYDNLYRLVMLTDAEAGETSFTYDAVGNRLTLTDPEDNTTTWTYDDLDRVIEEENELSLSRTFTLDAAGNLLSKTDRNGRETQYEYDNLYRTLEEIWWDEAPPAPSGSVSTTTTGSITDEVQHVGFSSMMITGGTFTLSFGGNTTGNIAWNASAATVQTALEGLGGIGSGNVTVSIVSANSQSRTWQLTFAGSLVDTNVAQVTINTANITCAFPPLFNTQTTTTGGGVATNEVQVVTVSNKTGGTFTISFDGQTTSNIAWNAAAGTVDSALEALSNIDTVTVGGAAGGPYTVTFTGSQSGINVVPMTVDTSNLENFPIERNISYAYDANSRVTTAADSSAEYNYTYDNMGRVKQQTQEIAGLTPMVTYAQTFDAASNRLTLAATIGSTADFKNTYTYDNLNRMTQVKQDAQSGGNAVAQKRVDFLYNAAGQFTQIKRYEDLTATYLVAQTDYGYDGIGRLTALDHVQGGTGLNAYDYTYDAASRISTVTSTADGLTTYSYDDTDQLIGADNASPRADETYSYDDNGNRAMGGYTTGDNNQTTSDGTYNYEYDAEGNMTKKTAISGGAYEAYDWDHRNRLTKVTFKNSSHVVQKTVDYSYDVYNRMVRRTYDSDGPGGAAAVDQFFSNDDYEIALEFDAAAATDVSHRYLWGPAVDQILADEQVTTTSSAGNIIHPLTDNLGTTRDLADHNTGTHVTTVTNHRIYDGFGVRTNESNSAVDLIFGFTGKLFDEVTKDQYNINRFYAAGLGQWKSEDPIGFHGGDFNLRRYVRNSALTGTDSLGLAEPSVPLPDKLGNPQFDHLVPPEKLPPINRTGVVDNNRVSFPQSNSYYEITDRRIEGKRWKSLTNGRVPKGWVEHADAFMIVEITRKRGFLSSAKKLGTVICESNMYSGKMEEMQALIAVVEEIKKRGQFVGTIVIYRGMTAKEADALVGQSTNIGRFIEFRSRFPDATYGRPGDKGFEDPNGTPPNYIPYADVEILRPTSVAVADSLSAALFGISTDSNLGPNLPQNDGDATHFDDTTRTTVTAHQGFKTDAQGTIRIGPTVLNQQKGMSRQMCEERGSAFGSTINGAALAEFEFTSRYSKVRIVMYKSTKDSTAYFKIIGPDGKALPVATDRYRDGSPKSPIIGADWIVTRWIGDSRPFKPSR